MEQSIISKIKKLLALAKDKSDEESHTAILRARKLMLKYNVSESEITGTHKFYSKEVVNESVFRTKLLWWHKRLANTISDNFRCSYYIKVYDKYNKEIRFVGLKEDVAIAIEIYIFSLESIKYHSDVFLKSKEIKRKWKRKHEFKNDYIEGYISGLDKKFREQNISESLELSIVQDELVIQYYNSLSLRNTPLREPKKAGDTAAWSKGYHDGQKFEKSKMKIE